jgi:hypothetical protein
MADMMKITTLVPAFKVKYFTDLLIALRFQTRRPDSIIISDDSPNRDFQKAIRSTRLKPVIEGLNVSVIDGPQQGTFANRANLFRNWDNSTEYFHFLFDDDLIYPDFYQRHLSVLDGKDALCSVSKRWTALESGQPIYRPDGFPESINQHPSRVVQLTSKDICCTTIPGATNWLGEMSNALFRADARSLLENPVLWGQAYAGLWDLGAFLACSESAPILFLNESLGCFRQNPGQTTRQTSGRSFKLGLLAWIALAISARSAGKIDRSQMLSCVQRIGSVLLRAYSNAPDMRKFITIMPTLVQGDERSERDFCAAWAAHLA